MDWLTKAFTQYSVAWIVLSAVVGLISGVVSSWITYQFKKRELLETTELKKQELREAAQLKQREIVATVLGDIEKQRKNDAIVQEKERKDRVRNDIIRWANPILGAVEVLDYRLNNILFHDGYRALNKDRQVTPGWSMTYDYCMPSTLYLFAQYFAWIQMLQELLSFELFRSEQTKDEFFNAITAVSEALGSYPALDPSCKGEDRQVFRLQQRAIGELLILRDSTPPRCMGYPDFLQKWQEKSFECHLEPLRTLLENVSPDDNCRWTRLKETQKKLGDLKEKCHRVLKLPAETAEE